MVRLLALALLDIGAVLLANYAARGQQRFHAELDSVISQVRHFVPKACCTAFARGAHHWVGTLPAQALVSAMNTVTLGVLLPSRHTQAIRVFAAQDGGLRAGLAVLPSHVFASSPTCVPTDHVMVLTASVMHSTLAEQL